MSLFRADPRTQEARPDGRRRLPPGQRLTDGWPVLHYGSIPKIDLGEWRLQVFGLVEEEVTLSWEQFMELPQTAVTNDIHCVTTWSKLDTQWEGVLIDDILAAAALAPPTGFTLAHSFDGYSTNVPAADLVDGKAMVALRYGGAPLTADHGGPARLLVPHLYFWKSAKWLSGLQFTEQDTAGFWELRGYHMYGDPWREQRYDSD